MFLDENTVIPTSTHDQIQPRTDWMLHYFVQIGRVASARTKVVNVRFPPFVMCLRRFSPLNCMRKYEDRLDIFELRT